MIYIFYCTLSDQLDQKSFNIFLKKLPKNVQSQVLKFKGWDDKQRSLFSKLLLITGLSKIGVSYTIDQIKFTKYRRPYFDDCIDFNISHSGDYIICGLSFRHKIGVDIEQIKEIPLGDFENEFSKKEMDFIINSNSAVRAFYTLWTQKEAFLKAIGTGLYVSLNKISIDNNKVQWNKQDWFIKQIIFDEDYIAHICSDSVNSEIRIEKISFEEATLEGS